MVGTATALVLQERGDDVLLVDRKGVGREASYGNAGAIQTEAVEPYPFPRSLAKLLAIGLGRGNAVRWHLASLNEFCRPLYAYWRNSSPANYQRACQSFRELVHAADRYHAPLITAAGAEDLIRRDGYHVLFRSGQDFDQALIETRHLKERWGVASYAVDADGVAAREPAMIRRVAGAVHFNDVWTCRSPGGLTAAYGKLFARRGGEIGYGDAASLRPVGAGWQVRTEAGTVAAARVVLALGAWSVEITRRLGYRIPLFTKRGYHRHFEAARGPSGPVFDAENAVFLSPMAQGLRLTTGAEFTRMDARIDHRQIRQGEKAARELFEFGGPVETTPWFGHRPCLPDMLPVIGEAPRHPGLWFHFGHAHQGFTAGPATAAILADRMAGQESDLMRALDPRRFD